VLVWRYHPLGFAYFADGAHKEVDELEPGIAPPGAADMSCADALTCQAPMYFKNGEYVGGSYDNSVAPVVPGDDFGLDAYEPEFFLPRADWIEQGTYEVKLTLSDADTIDDVFYFCHIHNEMSGRIKIVDADGVPLRADDAPELGYEYDVISDFDASCGTHDAYPYRAGAGACSDTFICADGSTETSEQLAFAECLHAIDCAMEYNMRSTLDPTNPITTFIHQMIPHHDNAINMAKLLLKQDVLDADSDMYHMLWDIINTQNFQIDTMQAWLDDNDAPRTAVCSLCNDSASWHKRGDPSKDCAWVAQWSPRCTVKGEDRELAEVGCPEACGICSNPDGVLIGSS